jgi:hypothetical protein
MWGGFSLADMIQSCTPTLSGLSFPKSLGMVVVYSRRLWINCDDACVCECDAWCSMGAFWAESSMARPRAHLPSSCCP